MKTTAEKILLPKGTTIVEGSFQVQIGTDFIGPDTSQGDGEFSQPLTSQQLLNIYGVEIDAVDREISIPTGVLEFTDFEVEIGQNGQGQYSFKSIPAVPA